MPITLKTFNPDKELEVIAEGKKILLAEYADLEEWDRAITLRLPGSTKTEHQRTQQKPIKTRSYRKVLAKFFANAWRNSKKCFKGDEE